MILGNFAAQRGWLPDELTDWYHRSFVDGDDWVMVPNVIGMSQHADLGIVATEPYVAGGAYLNTTTDYCGRVSLHGRLLVVPLTNRGRLHGNSRMIRALGGLDRLRDSTSSWPRSNGAAPARPVRATNRGPRPTP